MNSDHKMRPDKDIRIVAGVAVAIIILLIILASSALRTRHKPVPATYTIAGAFERLVSDAACAVQVVDMGYNYVVFKHIDSRPVIRESGPFSDSEGRLINWTLEDGMLARNNEIQAQNISALLFTPYEEDGNSLADDYDSISCLGVEIVGDRETEDFYLKTLVWLRPGTAAIRFADFFSFRDGAQE